ncbi:MAG: hypothetical protein ACPG6V_11840 [Flavobacteriales bacterium]
MFRVVKSGNTFDKCGTASDNAGVDKRVEADTQFHRFRIKYTTSSKTARYFIDGNFIGQTTNKAINITRFEFFNNRTQTSSPNASVAFFAFYNAHLQTTDIENFDNYLACKFELQP